MSLPRSSDVSVRRYLSEAGEKEVLRVLQEHLRHQRRVTSDDVRLAVRVVASEGGRVALPPDFPPAQWVLEFKRVYGFVQFNSFAFGGGKAAFGLPERLEMPSLRSSATGTEDAYTSSQRHNSSQNITRDIHRGGWSGRLVQITDSSMSSNNNSDDEKEKNVREDSRRLYVENVPMLTSAAAIDRQIHATLKSEAQRQVQLQHGFSQRHRHFLQQQQRRARLVDGHRRNVGVWSSKEAIVADQDEIQSSASSATIDRENGTSTGPGNSSLGGQRRVQRNIRPMPPRVRQSVSISGSVSDEMKDTASNASSSNKDARGYKLSHTVPAETWEKAIAAVEHQGMSLRAAAKMYGVHFAALHRRVKKRAQGNLTKGSNGYFHSSDEAGIMRVVVARAELGVLMTFAELMRLVEAAALSKLPNLSVNGARNLLTRFQSRNEQSIRHIIDDWPSPHHVPDTCTSSSDTDRTQRHFFLEHPGFKLDINRAAYIRGDSARAPIAASMVAAAKTPLFVPPSRVGPLASGISRRGDKTTAQDMRTMNDNRQLAKINGKLPGSSNGRLLFVGRAGSEGDDDVLMVV